MKIRWEYKVEICPFIMLETHLNEFGNEGWELVSIRRKNPDEANVYHIFKRPKDRE